MKLPRFLAAAFLCLAFLASAARAQFVITEFMAVNTEDIEDEDGNHEDWIEIYNSGLSAASLLGWHLTDSAGQLRKWPFPDKTLQPGQYLVVFASNKDRRNPAATLHTNFKLDAGGEFLALTKAETNGGTTIVQSWNPYLPQAADVSYGITQSGATSVLVGAASSVKWLVPNATTGPAIGTTWRGGNEPFAETGWSSGTAALGISGTATAIATANLQHRYNATSATLGFDSSGLGRTATISGASFLASDTDAAAAPIKRTGLMQFVGAENDQVSIPANAAYNVSASTVCFWMRANPPTGAGNSGAMLWDRRPDYGTAGIVIVQLDDGKIYLQSNNDYCSFGGSQNVSDNVWHHVAATMNQGAGQPVTLYVDGVAVGSTTNTASWGWTTTQAIELGRSHDSYWKRYTGLMDDVRFYNRILTATEIQQIANGGDTTMGTSIISTSGVDAADIATTLSGFSGTNPSAFVRIPFTVADPCGVQWRAAHGALLRWLRGVDQWDAGGGVQCAGVADMEQRGHGFSRSRPEPRDDAHDARQRDPGRSERARAATLQQHDERPERTAPSVAGWTRDRQRQRGVSHHADARRDQQRAAHSTRTAHFQHDEKPRASNWRRGQRAARHHHETSAATESTSRPCKLAYRVMWGAETLSR